jgi:hypothetical protein
MGAKMVAVAVLDVGDVAANAATVPNAPQKPIKSPRWRRGVCKGGCEVLWVIIQWHLIKIVSSKDNKGIFFF